MKNLEVLGLHFVATLAEGLKELVFSRLHRLDAVGQGSDGLAVTHG